MIALRYISRYPNRVSRTLKKAKRASMAMILPITRHIALSLHVISAPGLGVRLTKATTTWQFTNISQGEQVLYVMRPSVRS